MSTYFDTLNDDIKYIILFNVHYSDYEKLVKSEIFNHILNDYKFWNLLIKYNFKKVNLKIVPNYLYIFEDTDDFITYYSNYFRLADAYNYAISFVTDMPKDTDENGEVSLKFTLNSINNIKVLNLYYTKRLNKDLENDILRLYYPVDVDNDEASITIRYNLNDGFMFELQHGKNKISYKVTSKDVLNLFFHKPRGGYHSLPNS